MEINKLITLKEDKKHVMIHTNSITLRGLFTLY